MLKVLSPVTSFSLRTLKRTPEADPVYPIMRRKLHDSQNFYPTDLIPSNARTTVYWPTILLYSNGF